MADLPRSPLHDLHARGVMAFGEVDGWEMPRVFENIKMEYLAAKGTVASMDRSNSGRLRLTGSRRLDLLHRLTTQDVRSLAPGQGARTVMLTDKGRIVDDLRLYAGDDHLMVVTSPGQAPSVKERIEALRFRDDVQVEDVTTSTAMISLFGPQSAHLLEAASRTHGLEAVPRHHGRTLEVAGQRLLAVRTAGVGGTGFHLIVAAEGAAAVWISLADRGGPFGFSPLGEEAYEMLRIERGVPRFGRELTADHNPLEARLDDVVSWTKGCYIGQEVVARLDSRQKVSQLLVGLWMEPGPLPEAGSRLESADRPGVDAGEITSVAPSLDFRRVIALGYARQEASSPGTRLTAISTDDRLEAVVSDLPFASPPG